uniref:TF-B3 domain-containing protein n=2 Tax=Vitis vinifera TaxID=29760 RepID=F6HQC2_VITVI
MEMVQEERAMMGKNMTNGRLGRARLWRPSWFCSRKGSLSLFIGLSKYPLMEQAKKIIADHGSELPSLTRTMSRSNVAKGFWMYFPRSFCKLHLPENDATIILEDEAGEEYETNFLVNRSGLSAGWRKFSLDHQLKVGDILVFLLVGPCKFKVFIVRVENTIEDDVAGCLLDLRDSRRKNPSLGRRSSREQ